MTPEQRLACKRALLNGCSASSPGERDMLEFCAKHEVELLEPFIDALVFEAYQAGVRFADRKTEVQILKLEPRRVD